MRTGRFFRLSPFSITYDIRAFFFSCIPALPSSTLVFSGEAERQLSVVGLINAERLNA